MSTPAEFVWLLAAVAKGDQVAFERFYAATCAKLYGVILRILRRTDLADEVLQETYLKIWRSAGEFNPRLATPITWMVAIARNGALDRLRRQTEALIEDAPQALEIAAEDHDALTRRAIGDELKRLLACMGALEEEHRRVLLLGYYNGWTREQLATRFGQPVNTIKTSLRCGLLQIRDCLGA